MIATLSVIALLAVGQPAGAGAAGTSAEPDGTGLQQPARASMAVGLESRIRGLNARLEALRPDRPQDYFELGEEVAAEAASDADRRLAQDLFILSMELSREASSAQAGGASKLGPPSPALARSVCLALATMETSDEQRRWLIALADSTVAGPTLEPVTIRTTTASRDPAAFDLASALGAIRMGEGRRAMSILARPAVAALLERCDALLSTTLGGGAAAVRAHAEQWPTCPRCLNRRFVKEAGGAGRGGGSSGGGGGSSVVVCPHCQGTPGPRLSDEELLAQIRTESVLLSGQARSWAAQIVSDGGAPLRELDIDELARVYRVDPAMPIWRGGLWSPVPARPSARPSDSGIPEAR